MAKISIPEIRERRCYSLSKGKIYIIPDSSSDSSSMYISQNAMSSVSSVASMLRESGYKENTDFEVFFQFADRDNISDDIRTENLILLCGPKTNKLVESLFREFPKLLHSVRFELTPQPAFVYQGERYIFNDECDWALMAIKKNPYNSKRNLILLFGLRSIGTKGAGSFYANPGWAQVRAEVAKQLETQSGEIEVLLRVKYDNDYRTIVGVYPVALEPHKISDS